MFRVIAVDLDGTLLRSGSTLSPRTRSALDRCLEHGMKLVVATGRAKCSAATVLPEEFHRETWACCNGADIFENGTLVAQSAIDPEPAKDIVHSILKLFPDVRVFTGMGGELYSNKQFITTTPYNTVSDLRKTINGPVSKIAFDLSSPANVDMLRPHLPEGCRVIATVGGRLGEIMTTTATKAWAVETAIKRWGYDLSDVVAFGDETNDTEMIAECGLGVAMGNAHPEVKAIADRVTSLNDEDGVAEVLESILQENGVII